MIPAFAYAICAGGAALVCGWMIGKAAGDAARRKDAAAQALARDGSSRLLLSLQGGIKFLRPAARWLLERIPALEQAAEGAQAIFDEKSLQFSKDALLSLLMGTSAALAIVGGLLMRTIPFGIAIGCIVFLGALAWTKNAVEKRASQMREQVPDAIRALAMAFRSGHSLSQTLSASADETNGYLSRLFATASSRLEMGSTTSEALMTMRSNALVPELSFVAMALDIQHVAGGSISSVLESAVDSIEGEIELMRSLRVQTAQAKLSASIVTIMPFILVALFSIMSPGFLTPFFSSIAGMALLIAAIAMQVAGVVAVRRLLQTEEV